MADSIITHERLIQLLSYNFETGIFHWKVRRGPRLAGSIAGCSGRYSRIRVDYHEYLSHRLAWFYVHGEWPKVIDHKYGTSWGNGIDNLRDASSQVNSENRIKASKNSKSGVIGIRRSGNGEKWTASIGISRKSIYLGTFDTSEEASEAYKEAKKKNHTGFVIDRIFP